MSPSQDAVFRRMAMPAVHEERHRLRKGKHQRDATAFFNAGAESVEPGSYPTAVPTTDSNFTAAGECSVS
jgi:hypothetical protein